MKTVSQKSPQQIQVQEILAAINLPFFVGEEIWRAKGSTAALPRGDHSFFERQKSPV